MGIQRGQSPHSTWTASVPFIHGVPKGYDPGNPDKDIRFYAPEAQKKMDNAFNRAVEKGEPLPTSNSNLLMHTGRTCG